MSTQTTAQRLAEADIDAAALKPAEHDLDRATDLPLDAIAIDYEGHEHVPSAGLLRELAADREVRLTIPVRADGYDPLGDDERLDWLPDAVDPVLVAGHGAYLTDAELGRSIAPRLGAAVERFEDAWVGTEGIERIALATGAAQYELLSRDTEREIRALRAAGYDGRIALYAPTVLTDDPDELLDAVGDYVARRGPVAAALPEDASTDASAAGRARDVLCSAIDDYALVGTPAEISEHVATLKDAGIDTVVGYPARGLGEFLD